MLLAVGWNGEWMSKTSTLKEGNRKNINSF